MSTQEYNHYVAKAAITRGIIDGTPAIALCGADVLPEHQGRNAIPNEEVAHRRLETCPDCKDLYDLLGEKEAVREKERLIRQRIEERRHALAMRREGVDA